MKQKTGETTFYRYGILSPIMPRSSTRHDYTALGRRAILELLNRELAAPSLEIQARIADEAWPGIPAIDPHHLNDALRHLATEGRVTVQAPQATRGGRPVTLITATSEKRNITAVQKAAARKRLLTGRYLGWAQGTPTREAVIGSAAERVVHASITKAAPVAGYRIENPVTGGTAAFLGTHVAVGPLDNAALLSTVENGVPGPTVALPIEVKNLRDWLYPTNIELYQLLSKAAQLQQARPNVSIMPLLIARRMHFTTFRMFKDIGAFAVQTKRQYIGAVEGGDERLNEVRAGLGLLDLVQVTGDDDLITRRLTRVIPRNAVRVSEDWAITASDIDVVNILDEMRTESRIVKRSRLLGQLRKHLEAAGRYNGGW